MYARPLSRRAGRSEAPALRTAVRRPGDVAALASALGNRRFCALIARETKTAPAGPKLDYARAKRKNKLFAEPATETAISGLVWSSKLASLKDGAALDALWKAGSHKQFADAVAKL